MLSCVAQKLSQKVTDEGYISIQVAATERGNECWPIKRYKASLRKEATVLLEIRTTYINDMRTV